MSNSCFKLMFLIVAIWNLPTGIGIVLMGSPVAALIFNRDFSVNPEWSPASM
jgi:hypothetical protein